MTIASWRSIARIEESEYTIAPIYGLLITGALLGVCMGSPVQAQTLCGTDGTRVVGRRWDAVLKRGWEYRQECAHPEWPPRLVSLSSGASGFVIESVVPQPSESPLMSQPLLVHAGDAVRLWMQDEAVRIEMSGVAEQSARRGERVMVRTTQQAEDTGLAVQHIAGIVRGSEDVEMER